jgi:hypothetical protein
VRAGAVLLATFLLVLLRQFAAPGWTPLIREANAAKRAGPAREGEMAR